MARVRVDLVRHGQSLSNVERRLVAVPPGPGLTDMGRRQAARAAGLLDASGPVARILTSPLARTRETAAALVARTGLEAEVVDDLRELGFGAWEGRLVPPMREDPAYIAWHVDQEAAPPPGGERLSEAAVRVAAALERHVRDLGDGRIVAFSHHDPILAFYLLVGALPWVGAQLSIPNASIVSFAFEGDRWRWLAIDREAALGQPSPEDTVTA